MLICCFLGAYWLLSFIFGALLSLENLFIGVYRISCYYY